jgi:hypothetical protein
MEVLLRIEARDRQIDFGVATTRAERAAVLAQRFRVYQRHGYYRLGLTVDRDEYDSKAVYLAAAMRPGRPGAVLIGSARLVLGAPDPHFSFPSQKAFQFELPEAIREISVCQCLEVTRLVSERPEGSLSGGLLVPLGLIQAVSEYSRRRGTRCGLAVVKHRLLRALFSAGVPLPEIPGAGLIYPEDGATSPYYHRHADPVIPVWWRVEELAPLAARAIARYQPRRRTARAGAPDNRLLGQPGPAPPRKSPVPTPFVGIRPS